MITVHPNSFKMSSPYSPTLSSRMDTPSISSINSYTTSPYSPTTLNPPLQTHPHKPTRAFFAPFHPATNRLYKTLRKKFNIDPIFTSTPSLSNFLLKRRPPTSPLNKPGAVYAVPCECDLLYIGETKRTTTIRTAEVKVACLKVDRTNKMPNNTTNDLGITTHHKLTGHSFLFHKTMVLANETSWHQRKLLEGLYIEANKNKLVNLKSGTRVDNCWTPLFSSIPSLNVSL